MKTINLIFPNQIFEESELLNTKYIHYLIEEYLFFNQYNFHKQKIYFHRCSMKNYFNYLKNKKLEVKYVNSYEKKSDIRHLIKNVDSRKINKIVCINPEDNYLERRIIESCKKKGLSVQFFDNPAFINNREDLKSFFRKEKKKLFQTSFYKSERLRLEVLLDMKKNPVGGKWTFDDMNREKYPKNKKTPSIKFSSKTKNHSEAIDYVNKYFKKNNGELNINFLYPTDFKSAQSWFKQFLKFRFDEFGPYEDAVLKEESIINHSLLSPLLNSGLINPRYVINLSNHTYSS